MKPIQLSRIRSIIDAQPFGPLPADDPAIQAVTHDSRCIPPNSLFIAIRGERFDGHDFVANAGKAGAIAAVVERPVADAPAGMALLRVDSARAAMGRLARHVRGGLRGKVIAVAGSNGKTSTKHLIHDVLAGKLAGSMSPKSFNNDIGVPTTIFAAELEDDFLVLEMGTNHPGEIRTLTNIGRPDIAVLTCCAEEHLEFLANLDGVARENASIIEGMSNDGVLIVNGDDRRLIEATAGFRGRRVTFGFEANNELRASAVECGGEGTRFQVEGAGVFFVPMLGEHAAGNALAAIAVAREMGMTDREIADRLKLSRGPEMRLELKSVSGIQVLNDAYNANPGSVRSAVRTFEMLATGGRKVAVIGEMKELGESSDAHHRDAGRLVAAAAPDVLVCVGERGKLIAESAGEAGLPREIIRWFPDAASAAAAVPGMLRRGDLVLLKASRAVKLETIYAAIAAMEKPPSTSAS